MTAASLAQVLSRPRLAPHIVDVLIAERAPKLTASPLWPFVRPVLYGVLDYGKARRMADAIAALPGPAALDWVAQLLALQVAAQGLERLPARGRVIVVCNHPTGIADGLAVFDALKRRRDDICFYANADALRVSPRLDEVLIPVEWVEAKRTRERTRRTLELTRAAMEAERCLVVFPAGRLARRQADGSLADLPWAPSAVSLARRHHAPILPLHVAGPWSTLFHFFHGFSAELRDITLFHELLNKTGQSFSLLAGPLIAPDTLEGDPAELAQRLKVYVERLLPAAPDRGFAP